MKKHLFLFLIACLFIVAANAQDLQSFKFTSSGTNFKFNCTNIGGITIFPSVRQTDNTEVTIIQKNVEYEIDANQEYTVSGLITYLDVEGDSNYQGNHLTSLDVSNLTNLDSLKCSINKLTSLDVSNLTNLKGLYCFNNYLTSLDVSNLTNLEELYCFDNLLTSLDVSNLTNLEALHYSYNQLSNIDLSNLTNLKYLFCSNNQHMGLDVSGLQKLEKLYCMMNELSSLSLSYLPKLKEIHCSNNKLNSLIISNLPELEELICSNNKLNSLIISNLPKLKFINCFNNKIIDLDVSGLPNLKMLNCDGNKLVSLDISGLQNLKSVASSENQLLDINNANTNSLSNFHGGYQNLWIPMTADANGGFISTNTYKTLTEGHKIELPEGFSFEAGRFKCSQIPNEEILFSTDIGWGDEKIKGKLEFDEFVDPQSFRFESSGTRFKLGKVTLYIGEIKISPSVKGVDNSETNIIQTDVEYEIVANQEYTVSGVIKVLGVAANSLTSLDVSNLTNMKRLYCYSNQLTSLDVSGLTNLERLFCRSNQLIDINNANTDSFVDLNGSSQNLWIPMTADDSGGFISTNIYNTIIEGHKIELPEGFTFEAGRFKCSQIPNEEILFSTDIGWGDEKISGKIQFERVIETPISVIKKLEGKDLLANQFGFVILDANEWIVSTAKNSENGEFTISIPAPAEAGTYNYILKEKNDGQQGYTYDTKEYLLELVVALNSENVLATSITIKDGETIVETPVFTNSYKGTSINELNADSQLKLFPNPVNDALQIESLEIIREVSIYDISGKILITQQVNDTHFSLSTAQLNAGMYIVKVQMAKGLEYRKIIKE